MARFTVCFGNGNGSLTKPGPTTSASNRPPPQVDLPGQLALDLVHCERAADAVVAAGTGGITLAQGELFSAAYFDGLAAEVDEGLQEAGVVSGARQGVPACVLRQRGDGHASACVEWQHAWMGAAVQQHPVESDAEALPAACPCLPMPASASALPCSG